MSAPVVVLYTSSLHVSRVWTVALVEVSRETSSTVNAVFTAFLFWPELRN